MIEVRNINKNFDSIKAIDNITAKIEEGHVFVLGDNRNDSTDSHSSYVGALPMSMLKGKVQAVLWPLSEIQWIVTPEYNELSQQGE